MGEAGSNLRMFCVCTCYQRAHTSVHSLELQTEKLACLSQCRDLRENHPKYSFPLCEKEPILVREHILVLNGSV